MGPLSLGLDEGGCLEPVAFPVQRRPQKRKLTTGGRLNGHPTLTPAPGP